VPERDVRAPRPSKEFRVDAKCVCPCHEMAERGTAPADMHEFHVAACCCDHRFIVPADCPQCIPMQESA
jgi:hypothetical protein